MSFCRDLNTSYPPEHWRHVSSLPVGCSRERFAIPVGEGGVNNALIRIWRAILTVNHTREMEGGRTLLLPYLRNHPARFKPAKNLGPSKLIPIDKILDISSLCEALRELNLCFLCRHEPPGRESESAVFREALPSVPAVEGSVKGVSSSNEALVWLVGGVGLDTSPRFFWFLRGLKPNPTVWKAVKSLISQFHSHNYLAVHMRIEDDWRAFKRGKFYLSASQIVGNITASRIFRHLREETGTLPGSEKNLSIFVATGEHGLAKEAWSTVPNIHLVFHTDDILRDTAPWAARSIVDFEVARDAAVFVGTGMYSTFTTNLAFFRYEEAKCQSAIRARRRRKFNISQSESLAFSSLPSYAYHNVKKWGEGLLKCRQTCWGKE